MYQRRDFSLNDTWEALFDRRLGQRVEVMVRIPSNAPVGKEMFREIFGLVHIIYVIISSVVEFQRWCVIKSKIFGEE